MIERKYTFSFPPLRNQKVPRSQIKSKIVYNSNKGVYNNLVLQKKKKKVCLTKVYLKFQFKYSLSSPSNLLNFFLAVRGFSIYQTPEVETLFIYVLLYLILDSECLLDYSPTSASIITSLAMSSIPGLL